MSPQRLASSSRTALAAGVAPCDIRCCNSASRGAAPAEGDRRRRFETERCEHLLLICVVFFGSRPVFHIKVIFQQVLVCFSGSFTHNYGKSRGNYIKNAFLYPKCEKFCEKSEFGHVQTCQGQSRWTSPCQLGGFLFFLQKLCLPFYWQI